MRESNFCINMKKFKRSKDFDQETERLSALVLLDTINREVDNRIILCPLYFMLCLDVLKGR